MNTFAENTYWIAIAHLPRWHVERINRLIVQVVHEHKLSWSEFFELDKKGWREIFAFNEKELADMELAKNDIPRLAFIAEQLQNEGFDIIPINSPEYPQVLKENLKMKSSPPVLYVKGRKSLLQEEAVAIVGSRKAGKAAIDFTERIAAKSVREQKVVVSGFAKGVDKQALDSTLEAHGKSIIVLPQGILTFQSGFKKYYEPIVNGEVLVLSTFFPKAGWEVGLAMARNAYIYGLANEIYVAESDDTGGTWQGVIDGLKRQRKIFVRVPGAGEKNANHKLIALGAMPVNGEGEVMEKNHSVKTDIFDDLHESNANEASGEYENSNIEKDILDLLTGNNYTCKEIKLALKLDWDSKKLTAYLKKNPNVQSIVGKPLKYTRNAIVTPTLFE
ncbi:MAG: DNA-protecting protein DprA [Bacteroidetes bacterium]|nr:DNA-protecting protein DprA [Bacteroidota bacterium]